MLCLLVAIFYHLLSQNGSPGPWQIHWALFPHLLSSVCSLESEGAHHTVTSLLLSFSYANMINNYAEGNNIKLLLSPEGNAYVLELASFF